MYVYLIGNGTGMYNINLLLYINDQFALTIDDLLVCKHVLGQQNQKYSL